MRIRVNREHSPGAITFNGITTVSNPEVVYNFCEDDISEPSKLGELFTRTKILRLGRLSGAFSGRQVDNFCPLYNETVIPPRMEYDIASLRSVLTRHMAQANPSRSSSNFSETIAELPKLPDLMKFKGDSHLKTYGSAMLNTQFGWAPLIQDVLSLLFVAADTDAMLERIKRLSKGEKFTSKRKLERRSTPITRERVVINSLFMYLEATVVKSMSIKGHTFIKFSPDPYGLPPTDASQRVRAYTAAKGLQLGLYEAWQLVPWSWLVDWTFNVSEYCQATQNTIGAEVTEAYAAVKSLSRWEFETPGLPHGLTWDRKPVILREDKRRIPLTPDIAPSLPLVNAYRAGILSALIAKWV